MTDVTRRVQTVTGTADARELGRTLIHEHVLLVDNPHRLFAAA